MNTHRLTPSLLIVAAFVCACSTVPVSTTLLDETRGEYVALQNTPNVNTYASLELKQAGDAMDKANMAATQEDSKEQIDQLAYIAQRKISLAQEVVKTKTAEASVAMAGQERDQMRLDQRTQEADQAKASEQTAHGEAMDSQRQTVEAQAHSAQLESQLADLSAKQTDRGIVITVGDILFGTDVSDLNSEGVRTAQKLADVLQQNPDRTVTVEGYTDSTGSSEHNQALSERRAGAVRNALTQMGVGSDRITTRGLGESNPIAANNTAQNRQLNRRVEIILSNGPNHNLQH